MAPLNPEAPSSTSITTPSGRYRLLGTDAAVAIASVQASSVRSPQYPWYQPGKSLDGSLTTAWAPAPLAVQRRNEHYLDYVLGGCSTLTKLALKLSPGGSQGVRVDVAVKRPGDATFTMIALNQVVGNGVLSTLDVPDTQATAVRLFFRNVSPKTDLFVCEVRLKGEPCGHASPSPSPSPSASPSSVPSDGPSATPSPGPSASPTPSIGPSASASPQPSTAPCVEPIGLSPLLLKTAVLAATTVTNTGPSVIAGDVDLSPGTSITGFTPGIVLPPATIHQTDATAAQAQSDLTIAKNDAAGRPATSSLPGGLGGQVLTPGVYANASAVLISGTGITLDGEGNPDAVFIFQIGSTLILAPSAHINLINGAQACNVFWQVGSAATLDVGTVCHGSILAGTSITLNTGAQLFGRALAQTGAVTLDTNAITTSPASTAGSCASPSPAP